MGELRAGFEVGRDSNLEETHGRKSKCCGGWSEVPTLHSIFNLGREAQRGRLSHLQGD